MSTPRIFDPAKLGILSCLPLEIRQSIYDYMCTIDSPVYEFEIEGPANIHIPATTLELLQNPRVPRIAQVCSEMRDYALVSAATPISFTYYVFGTEIRFDSRVRIELPLERQVVKSSFRFRFDILTFKPHEVVGVDEFDFGEGDYIEAPPLDEELQRLRVCLLPGSGGLPSSEPEGYTHFEEFVQARRNDYVSQHPEAATAQRVSRYERAPKMELIKQQRPHYALFQRCYDLSGL